MSKVADFNLPHLHFAPTLPWVTCTNFAEIFLCASVYLYVYLSVCLSENRVAEPPVFSMLPVVVAQSSTDGVAIRYIRPVLRITSWFPTMGPIGGRTGTALCTSSPVAARETRPLWVGRPASWQAVLLPRRPRARDVVLLEPGSSVDLGAVSLLT